MYKICFILIIFLSFTTTASSLEKTPLTSTNPPNLKTDNDIPLELKLLKKRVSKVESNQKLLPIISRISNAIVDLVTIFAIIGFLVWLLWKRKWIIDILKSSSKGIELNIFGQQLKILPNEVEKEINLLEFDIEKIQPKGIGDGIIPYATDEEIEKVIKRMQVLEMIGLKIDAIEKIPVLKLMGSYYYMNEDFDKALSYYRVAEKISNAAQSKDYSVFNAIGHVYLAYKDFDIACTFFEKVVELEPELPWGHQGIAEVYSAMEKDRDVIENYCNRAIGYFEKLISLKPMDYMAYFGLATTYRMLNNYEKAIENLNTVIKIRPAFAPAYYNKAIAVLIHTGDNDEAIGCLRKAFVLNRNMKAFAIKDPDLEKLKQEKCYKCLIT